MTAQRELFEEHARPIANPRILRELACRAVEDGYPRTAAHLQRAAEYAEDRLMWQRKDLTCRT